MTTTDTRIADLLGWESMGSGDCRWWTKEQDVVIADFTTDLNLTVREIERKGWTWSVSGTPPVMKNDAFVWSSHVPYEANAQAPAEALALAFLAALEAEKEGE